VTLNERRATPHGPFWGATRGDEAIFPRPALQFAYVQQVQSAHCALFRKKMATVAGVFFVV